MSKKDDLLDNNDDKQKTTKPRQPRKKPTEQPVAMKATKKTTKVATDPYLNPDEIINVELYNEILSTLYNSLSNPIVRNEIKVNETILKYLELQISNLFFLESALAQELTGHKMAKEFLQLTANIMDLALSISKSPKKTRIEILEDRNLLVVTIVNSCKGVERESLERIRPVDSAALQTLGDQISALSDFTSEEKAPVAEDTDYEQEEDSTEPQREDQTANNQLNNQNMRDLNANMANLTKLGMLPEHPMAKPNFYPYLTKPHIIPLLKKILAGLLIASSVFVLITIILSLYVKGTLEFDTSRGQVAFALSQTNNWLILIMTLVLYASFAYMFIRPAKVVREKYRISYFILGLLFFWLIVTMFYYFWQISDGYYKNFFEAVLSGVEKGNIPEGVDAASLVETLKGFNNFTVFKIFAMIAGAFSAVPLLIVLVLILINPRIDRKKIMRANIEYQNAINAALNGKKYDMDPTLFDHDEPSDKKRKKANFSGRF